MHLNLMTKRNTLKDNKHTFFPPNIDTAPESILTCAVSLSLSLSLSLSVSLSLSLSLSLSVSVCVSRPHLLLHGAELHADDELRLGGHVLEDVGLEPAQHVGPQHVVELLDLVLLGDVRKLLQEALQVAAAMHRKPQRDTNTQSTRRRLAGLEDKYASYGQ